jgi:hypothetical protein
MRYIAIHNNIAEFISVVIGAIDLEFQDNIHPVFWFEGTYTWND